MCAIRQCCVLSLSRRCLLLKAFCDNYVRRDILLIAAPEMGSAAPKFVHYVGSTSMWFNRNPALLRPYENLDSLLLLFPFERKYRTLLLMAQHNGLAHARTHNSHIRYLGTALTFVP